MSAELTLESILQAAIKKEIDSQRLYTDLSGQVNDRATKEALQGLASDEKGHQTLLERYLNGEIKEGALSHSQAADYKLAEHLEQPEISPDMALKDVFLLAARREKISHDFYLELASIHPMGKSKTIFRDMASQELVHKHRVESFYTDVAFPQTAGG